METYYSGNKAGFNELDKEKVTKIIAENSSSKFDDFKKKQEEKLAQRVSELKKEISTFTAKDIGNAEIFVDNYIACQEIGRKLNYVMLHIDMDAFYAAVEMRDDPSLRDVPMAVGGMSMLSTSNYHARKFGVRSGMPGYIGLKLCPKLKIVDCNFTKYRKASRVVQSVFLEYDPNLSMGSLDEAYMNITEYMMNRSEPKTLERCRFKGDCVCKLPLVQENDIKGICEIEERKEICDKCKKERICVIDKLTFGITEAEVVKEIRFRVQQTTGLTCSAGIAANWLLAKICSDINKPNGQYELKREREEIMTFMKNLNLRKVNGIGQQTSGLLKALDINICDDVYKKRGILKLAFSELTWTFLIRTYLGIGCTMMSSSKEDFKQKSISTERTFRETDDVNICLEHLKNACEELAESLESHGIKGGYLVSLKCRKDTFERYTRSQSVKNLISTKEDLFDNAKRLLLKEMSGTGVCYRLLGVGLGKLLFNSEEEKNDTNKKVTRIMDYFTKKDVSSDDDVICLTDIDKKELKKNSKKEDDIVCIGFVKKDVSKNQLKDKPNRKRANIDFYFKPIKKGNVEKNSSDIEIIEIL